MIAFAKDDAPSRQAIANPEDHFLCMLPLIRAEAISAFRSCRRELREELTQEVIANAYCAFARLVALGKQDIAYATPLAAYAVRAVRSGRRVGVKANVKDVTSPCAQKKGIVIERLDKRNGIDGGWMDALVEDRKAGPAETAAARLDIAAWLRSLPRRRRRIAKTLAAGEAAQKTACMFGVSPARISQLRRELHDSWVRFHGPDTFA